MDQDEPQDPEETLKRAQQARIPSWPHEAYQEEEEPLCWWEWAVLGFVVLGLGAALARMAAAL